MVVRIVPTTGETAHLKHVIGCQLHRVRSRLIPTPTLVLLADKETERHLIAESMTGPSVSGKSQPEGRHLSA